MKRLIISITPTFILICGCNLNKQEPSAPPATIQEVRPNVYNGGEASVYADKFQGRKTASGELFDQNQLTAASKTLPLGSTAKVTNKQTGKSAVVKITDRGPYAKGRAIDLSKAAAKSIDMDPKGTAQVVVERIRDSRSQNQEKEGAS